MKHTDDTGVIAQDVEKLGFTSITVTRPDGIRQFVMKD